MYFDPLYMLVMGVGLVLSLGAQAWVKAATAKWAKVPIGRGLTGRDVAQLILDQAGVRGVKIEQVGGILSDHYDPSSKTLRLSEANYSGRSVTAAGIAAHEVGHALQDAENYPLMALRQKLVPVANIGSTLGIWIVMIGAMVGAMGIAKIGVLIFAGFVLFTVVTLPIELDASSRAKRALLATGVVNQQEAKGVSAVLTAAAATYLAAMISAVLQLLYWAMRAGLLGGRDD